MMALLRAMGPDLEIGFRSGFSVAGTWLDRQSTGHINEDAASDRQRRPDRKPTFIEREEQNHG